MSFEEKEALLISWYNEYRVLEDMSHSNAAKRMARRRQADVIERLDRLYKEYFDGVSSSNS